MGPACWGEGMMCPICENEMGALISTPNGVMCSRCWNSSPCKGCNRAKCEYCPEIDLNDYRTVKV